LQKSCAISQLQRFFKKIGRGRGPNWVLTVRVVSLLCSQPPILKQLAPLFPVFCCVRSYRDGHGTGKSFSKVAANKGGAEPAKRSIKKDSKGEVKIIILSYLVVTTNPSEKICSSNWIISPR